MGGRKRDSEDVRLHKIKQVIALADLLKVKGGLRLTSEALGWSTRKLYNLIKSCPELSKYNPREPSFNPHAIPQRVYNKILKSIAEGVELSEAIQKHSGKYLISKSLVLAHPLYPKARLKSVVLAKITLAKALSKLSISERSKLHSKDILKAPSQDISVVIDSPGFQQDLLRDLTVTQGMSIKMAAETLKIPYRSACRIIKIATLEDSEWDDAIQSNTRKSRKSGLVSRKLG